MSEETQQLRRYACENSETAFTALVQSRIDFVYSCALRRVGGDAHLAEDVVQRVFSELARQARALATRETLGGWLFTATRNIARDVVRNERRRRVRELEAHVMNQPTSGDLSAIEWEQLRPVLDVALDALRENEREAVLLRFLEGKAFAAVAAQLGITEGAAQMRVQRSLRKMQRALERNGLTSTSAGIALALGNQVATAAPTGMAASVAGAALGGTITAGSGAGVALIFMSIKSTLGVTAAVSLLVAITVFSWKHSRQADIQLHETETRVMALRGEMKAVEELAARQMALKAAPSNPNPPAAAPRPPPTVSPIRSLKNGADDETNMEAAGDAFLRRHPELVPVLDNYYRGVTRKQYQPLYAMLALSREQVERFESAMAKGMNTLMGGLVLRLNDGDLTILEPKLRGILGDEGYQVYLEYNKRTSIGRVPSDLLRASYFTDSPLQPDQLAQLTKIVGELTISNARQKNPGAPSEEFAQRLTTAASAILNPQQLKILQSQFEQQKFDVARMDAQTKFLQEQFDAARKASSK